MFVYGGPLARRSTASRYAAPMGMKDPLSTESWKAADFRAIEPLLRSNDTFKLERAYWPPWAQRSTQMERLWVHLPTAENPVNAPGVNASIVARALTERLDSRDSRPYNYNVYLFAQSTDGRLYQSPPIRATIPNHHEAMPPSWLDSYGPPPL